MWIGKQVQMGLRWHPLFKNIKHHRSILQLCLTMLHTKFSTASGYIALIIKNKLNWFGLGQLAFVSKEFLTSYQFQVICKN